MAASIARLGGRGGAGAGRRPCRPNGARGLSGAGAGAGARGRGELPAPRWAAAPRPQTSRLSCVCAAANWVFSVAFCGGQRRGLGTGGHLGVLGDRQGAGRPARSGGRPGRGSSGRPHRSAPAAVCATFTSSRHEERWLPAASSRAARSINWAGSAGGDQRRGTRVGAALHVAVSRERDDIGATPSRAVASPPRPAAAAARGGRPRRRPGWTGSRRGRWPRKRSRRRPSLGGGQRVGELLDLCARVGVAWARPISELLDRRGDASATAGVSPRATIAGRSPFRPPAASSPHASRRRAPRTAVHVRPLPCGVSSRGGRPRISTRSAPGGRHGGGDRPGRDAVERVSPFGVRRHGRGTVQFTWRSWPSQ